MALQVIAFAEAVTSPLSLPRGWDDDNLRFAITIVLRERIARDGVDVANLDAPFEDFDALCAEIDERYVATLTAPYHDAAHARSVAARFRAYLAASGKSDVVQKLGFLAGLFHDAAHPGQRYREDVEGVEHRELSNEEYAASLAVEFLAGALNTSQLAWIYSAIIATSFGQRPGGDPNVNQVLAARPHLVRPYGPASDDEWLIHFADINSTGGPTGYEEFMAGGVKLAHELASGAPVVWSAKDKASFAKRQAGFLGYIGMVAEKAKASFRDGVFFEEVLRDLAEVRAKVQTLITVWTSDALISES